MTAPSSDDDNTKPLKIQFNRNALVHLIDIERKKRGHQNSSHCSETKASSCYCNSMATQSVSSATSNGIDASLLRNAIRLVHCLQKERGSSCAYYADNHKFEASMLEARSASDVSATLIQHKDLPIKSSLVKIRNLISAHKNPQASEDSMALHRIFVCFNTLISCVLHEFVLNQVYVGIDQTAWGSTIRNHHRRGLSFDINERIASETIFKPTTPEQYSEDELHQMSRRVELLR